MFLLQKYQNYLAAQNGNLPANAYVPNTFNIAHDAYRWIKELFTGSQYHYESIELFITQRDFMDQFIKHEMLNDSGVIRLIFPRGMYDEKKRAAYKAVTANFLKQLHQANLRNNNLEESNAFDNLSFWYIDEENARLKYCWEGKSFSATNPNCVQIGIKVVAHEDYEKNTFENYIKYLITKERNSIADFDSSTVFWKNVIKWTRQKEPYYMEDRAVATKDLMLFCIALALDEKVFDKLLKLRKSKFKDDEINSPLPSIGESEMIAMRKFLMDAHWRLLDAKSQVKKPEDIPRKMLINANIDLLKAGLKSIL